MITLFKSLFAAGGGERIDLQEAVRRLDRGAVLVDVRERAEFKGGHAPAAQHLPLGRIRSKGVAALDALRLPADTREVLLVCHSGVRSRMAQGLLSKDGTRTYANVDGGMSAWCSRGLPIER